MNSCSTNRIGKATLQRMFSSINVLGRDHVVPANSLMQSLKRIASSPITLLVVLLSFLLLGLTLSNWAACLWFLAGVIICAIPGWFACRLLYGANFARQLDSLGHTLILGLLLTTFLSVVIARLGLGLTIPAMLAAAAGGALLLFLLERWAAKPWSPVQDDDPASTRLAINVGLIVVLIIVVVPFLNVGREVGNSYAYAPYFNRDSFRNFAFGASLAKGLVPPANPYLVDETLHYYWFQLVFPALVYRLSGTAASLESISLLATLLVNISFVFVFVHSLRQFVKRALSLVVVLGLAFVAESYQAPFKAVLSLQPTHWALEGTWFGDIALPPVGYFFQNLLYLPQHLAALVALLIVVSLSLDQSSQGKVKRTLAAAIVLVLSSGFSFFIAAFGFVWLGSFLAWQAVRDIYLLAKERGSASRRSSLLATTLAGIVTGLAGLATYALLSNLGMLLGNTTSWTINLGVSQLAAPLHFLVMLGPMFVLGLAGLVLEVRSGQTHSQSAGWMWLLLSAFLLVMFVSSKDLPLWEISQKLGVVLRPPLLIFTGIFLDYLIGRGVRQHKITWAALLLFCVSAAPNLLAYEYVHLNAGDSNMFTYVDAAEKRAADWIRQQTSADSVVQAWPGGQASVKPFYRTGEDVYSLIPVFGERQTAVGDPQFARYYVPRSRYPEVDARAAEISQVYQAPDRSDVVGIFRKFKIDYIYWGLSEKGCCSQNLAWYEKSSLFEKVYDQDGISIFRLKKG